MVTCNDEYGLLLPCILGYLRLSNNVTVVVEIVVGIINKLIVVLKKFLNNYLRYVVVV